MTGKIVARRYAKALFSLAEKAGGETPARYGADMEAVASAFATSPELVRILANPVIDASVKHAVMTSVGVRAPGATATPDDLQQSITARSNPGLTTN